MAVDEEQVSPTLVLHCWYVEEGDDVIEYEYEQATSNDNWGTFYLKLTHIRIE